MLSFEASTTIDATPDAVWTVLTDLPAYPSWDSGVTETEGEITAGAKIKLWTEVSVREEFDGLLVGPIGRTLADLQPSFDQLVAGLAARAEVAG